ncbi:MAG: hypothetical protein HYU80_02945 [Candidatus Blackburnbacteria bacterium]|nr:hypothetical protein [Candidatus Blackburnbacteria bacterium]
MQKERGLTTPYRDLVKPHEWDQWLEDHRVLPVSYYPERIRPKRRKATTGKAETEITQVTAYTVLGKPVEVVLGKTSRWDWDHRYVTKNCETCPLFVSKEDAGAIAQLLPQANGRAQINIPQDPQGICLFSSTPKFLVPHNSKAPMTCNSGPDEIEQRAATKGLKKIIPR